MKEYIEKDAALEATYAPFTMSMRMTVPECNGMNRAREMIFKQLRTIPAADVVEVDVKDLRVKKAIKTLCEFYSTAKKSDYVQKPLAWALYQTWKSFDKMDGGVNDAAD